jgi:hypothetical protein
MSQFNVPEEQQAQILRDRITSLNLDGFQQELNREIASRLEDDEQEIAAEQTITFISTAIQTFEIMLDKIGTDPIVEPVTDPEIEPEA